MRWFKPLVELLYPRKRRPIVKRRPKSRVHLGVEILEDRTLMTIFTLNSGQLAQPVINSAAPGDTLQLPPGYVTSEQLTIGKDLIVQGPGAALRILMRRAR